MQTDRSRNSENPISQHPGNWLCILSLFLVARVGLDLHLLEAVLPERREGGDAVIAEVDENVPVDVSCL